MEVGEDLTDENTFTFQLTHDDNCQNDDHKSMRLGQFGQNPSQSV